MLSLVRDYFLHKSGFYSLHELHVSIFERLFKGRLLSLFQRQVPIFLDQYFQTSLYLPAYQCLMQAKARGDFTTILSSSPDFLVEPIAEKLQVDFWQATTYELNTDQRFEKVSNVLDGEAKTRVFTDLAKDMGITREFTTAYSDSILDYPFLKAAGHAVAVKPDRQLRKHCRHEGWPVI